MQLALRQILGRHVGKGILFLETLALLEAMRMCSEQIRGRKVMYKSARSTMEQLCTALHTVRHMRSEGNHGAHTMDLRLSHGASHLFYS